MADETIVKLKFNKNQLVTVEMPNIDFVNYRRLEDAYHMLIRAYQTKQSELIAKTVAKGSENRQRTVSLPEEANNKADEFEKIFH